MRDEIDGRIWNEHHELFSELVDGTVAAARRGIARLSGWDGTSQHMLALALSFAVTALTFNGTTS